MKDEIENILGNINFEVETEQEWLEPLGLDRNTWKQILDYITNLQKENEILKDIVVEKDCQLKDMMLQKTDYTAVNILEMKLEYYKSRNDKAIEYITDSVRYINGKCLDDLLSEECTKLLEILGDKENE